ncbi:MAG: ATP-dependent DNA helicase RecQ, partial [Proteobacteria bacterium]
SGKSLCYQLPALVLPGLTLIVSPLLALMKDQIDALKMRGIHASRLDSTLSHDEYQSVMQNVRAGVTKILYVAPERFMNERFRNSLAGLSISLFAVDEAHCISAWGHNFRPDYLKLPLFAESFGARAILALTATATPQVLLDIEKSFKIQPGCAVVTGFYRPNLTLLTIPILSVDRDERLIAELVARDRGPTIIYVTLQKTAEKLSSILNERGIPAQFYHAGMENEDRVAVQNWFITSDMGIIVATIAFGMGIDKSDIRYVYHYNLPKSLESYSQEIGRAGRDGKPSVCAMFACPDDMNVLENFVYGDKPSQLSVHRLIEEIFTQGKTYSVSLIEASTRLDIRSIVLSTLMAYLELKGYVQAETPYYQIYQFKCLIPWPEIVAKLPEDR